MIARNESRCLARCLKSVRGGADEIVLVDTGSTDDTRKIAESFGARVQAIEWPEDFAKARNASLDLVETEWTLWLDADEWLVEGAADAIRRAIRMDEALAFTLIRRDTLPDGRYGEQSLLRLWRTHPALRFVGVIHEHFPDEALAAAFPGMTAHGSDIAFWHDGFREEATREKHIRNLALLRKELEIRPGQLYYEIELASTLSRLGDPEAIDSQEAIADHLAKLQDSDEPPCNTAELFLITYLADLPESELHSARTDALVRVARGWFPRSPTLLSVLSQIAIRRGDLHSAYSALVEVEKMAEEGTYDRTTSVQPTVLQEALFTNLALVAHQLGKREVARRNYERLLRIDPENPVANQNLRLL